VIIRLGDASELRTYAPLQVLLVALTFITGILDATTYLGFGNVFAANMTGNFVLLAVVYCARVTCRCRGCTARG
jgi:uncharacterized membrane protein YoaK (UPF0700 family)